VISVAHPRAVRRAFLLLLLTGAVLSIFVFPGIARAASPMATWRIESVGSPTHFAPGDESGYATYAVTVRNVGGAPTDGSPITVSDILPPGITVNPTPENFVLGRPKIVGDGGSFAYSAEACVDTVVAFSCTVEGVNIQSGEILVMFVPVNIALSASSPAVNHVSVSGGGAAEATGAETTPVTAEAVHFGFQGLQTYFTDNTGAAYTQAGGHPFVFHTDFQSTSISDPQKENPVAGTIKDVIATLPKGMVVNPAATPVKCTEAQFEASVESECPDAAAVGIVHTHVNLGYSNPSISEPLWNLVPPPGSAAAFGFNAGGFGIFAHLLGSVNSEGEFQLTSTTENILEYGQIAGVTVELWGNPTDASHDARRGLCGFPSNFGTGRVCPSERLDIPLLTMPSACSSQPGVLSLSMDSWQEQGKFVSGSSSTVDGEGNSVGVDGCSKLEFKPTIASQPTTNRSDSATGLNFNLHQPQTDSYETLATANLKDAKVTLPAGVTLNASAANGLAACDLSQIGFLAEKSGIHFSEDPQTCPPASRLGTLKVSTPLLEHELPGAIYLAKPYGNPFGSLLAIYLAIEDKESGIIVKLAGKVESDPATGQLTTTFIENPELPVEDIDLEFFEGPQASLKTPLACGTHSTTSDLTPWSTPEGADAGPADSFETTVAAAGSGPCPTSEAAAPNAPAFSAGTAAPEAGSYSPFLLRLARADGTQQISGIDVNLPAGLTGKLAGIPYCSEGDIGLARSREAPNQGAVEQASPSCPAASEVGTVNVGAGAGITPYYVTGHAYLAGPYKGAPISVVTIVPAVAGPFDLGVVVTRVALYVNEYSAQIHAVSDPLPTIIQGIPLDVRSISLKLSRPGFTLNPTSCEKMEIGGSTTSPTGSVAQLKSPFQVGGCKNLAFKPSVKLSLKGATKRAGHPALKAVVTYPKGAGYANIARAQVSLPHSEFLDQGNIGKSCTKPVLQAHACPASSIYGKAKAWSPLLEKPLEGPVYLVGGFGYKLPALVAELNGQVKVLLVGKVDTGKSKGIRNTFETVPDAPVERFVLEMKGGKKYGLLENSENLCNKKQKAGVLFGAQNGKLLQKTVPIANSCGKSKKGKGKKKHPGSHGKKNGK
jgi:uncharacterized repeat protein (TIGR01451 family)